MRKRNIVIVAVIVLLLGGVVRAVTWANEPETVTIDHTAVQADVAEGTKQLKTDLFTTMIPAGMLVKTDNKKVSPPLILQMLLADSPQALSPADQLAITIGILPSEGMAGVSGVQSRLNAPSLYQRVSEPGMPTGAYVFQSSADTFEIGAFWPHNGHYVELVMNGSSDHKTDLINKLKLAVTSWVWQ